MRAVRGPIVVFAVVLAGATLACKPKPGDVCTKGNTVCLDDKTALVCQDGKSITTPCGGPSGCRMDASVAECDISGNQEGDVCSTDYEGQTACTADGKSQITCLNGQYRILLCRGAKGCARSGELSVVCDVSIAEVGDSCAALGADAVACASDGKRMLQCREGKFADQRGCAGPAGCTVTPEGVACDTRVGELGDDACHEGSRACSADKKKLLACEGGKLVARTDCDGPKGCTVTDDPSQPIARLFDPTTVVCDTGL